MSASKIILALTAAASLIGMANPAAASDWQHRHPRRAQVVHRAHHQMHRIDHLRREGKLTREQAHALKANDRAIIAQQRADAHAQGGRITQEQKANLNHQLNAQSRAIGH